MQHLNAIQTPDIKWGDDNDCLECLLEELRSYSTNQFEADPQHEIKGMTSRSDHRNDHRFCQDTPSDSALEVPTWKSLRVTSMQASPFTIRKVKFPTENLGSVRLKSQIPMWFESYSDKWEEEGENEFQAVEYDLSLSATHADASSSSTVLHLAVWYKKHSLAMWYK